MAAFNYIDVIGRCPHCGAERTFSFQTHIASDFDGDGERFMEKHYVLGQKMNWFAPDHPEFECWKTLGECSCGKVHEFCHGECSVCGERLFVRIEFDVLTPVKSSALRLLEEWPRDPKNPGMRYSETVCEE